MSLVVLLVLGLLSMAVGLAGPMAELELRQGRSAFRALGVDAMARGGLTDLEQGRWIAVSVGVPIGGQVGVSNAYPRPGYALDRRIWRIGPDLWLGESVVECRDLGGSILASSRQGLLLRIGRTPADTMLRVRVTSRPWVTGFQ